MKSIRVSEDIVPIGEFKGQAAHWLRRISETGQPVIITQNGKPAGVLLSPSGFDRLQERQRFVARLIERASRLAKTPHMGRWVPELPESKLRELLEGNYRIVYRVRIRTIQVLTVFEGHRRFPAPDLPGEED